MEHHRAFVAGGLFILSLLACGSRSDTVSDEELGQTDCAAEDQKVQDKCQRQCATAPASVAPSDVNASACVESCVGEETKHCEATATCRCSLALTKLSTLQR